MNFILHNNYLIYFFSVKAAKGKLSFRTICDPVLNLFNSMMAAKGKIIINNIIIVLKLHFHLHFKVKPKK